MDMIRSPPQPTPLSSSNAYTTWPGGVDPTAKLFSTDNQGYTAVKGGKRKSNRKTKSNRKAKTAQRKRRATHRKRRGVSYRK
jgi:hypothetical protein